jgi:hypothetical protein
MMPLLLQLTTARYALELADPQELVDCADELLTQGIYTYSLGELYSIRDPVYYDVAPRFVACLRELSIAVPTHEQASLTLVAHFVHQIVEGKYDPREHLGRFWRESYNHLRWGQLRSYL